MPEQTTTTGGRFDDGENALYWAAQAEGWIEQNVFGKDAEVIAIAGDAVVLLDDDDWRESHVKALRDGLADGGFAIQAMYSDQVRIEATDERLVSEYVVGGGR